MPPSDRRPSRDSDPTKPARPAKPTGAKPGSTPGARPGNRPGTAPGGKPARKGIPRSQKTNAQRRGNGPAQPAHAERSGPTGTGDPGRDTVVLFLNHQVRRYPLLDLKPLRLPPEVMQRDASLAHAIADAAVARLLTLRCLIQSRLDQGFDGLEAPLRATLLCGAAQLILLDRVPAYAAIDHCVQWAKVNIRRGAGNLTNAVLRKIAALVDHATPRRPAWTNRRDELPMADGTALVLRDTVLPEDEVERLGVATSHTRALIKAWVERMGVPGAMALAARSLVEPPVTLNVAHVDADAIAAFVEDFRPHPENGCRLFVGTRESLTDLLGVSPAVWVQDAGSQRPARTLAEMGLKPSLIVDACAGQGTKTRQLTMTFPDAKVITTDADDRRRLILRDVFRDARRVSVVAFDGLEEAVASGPARGKSRGGADLVLLDVPCSNTGVLARRPEAKYRFGDISMKELIDLQQRIIRRGAELLSADRNAVLAYSTCSIEPAENQDQARWACAELGLELVAEHAHMPSAAGQAYSDGSYLAVLRRKR